MMEYMAKKQSSRRGSHKKVQGRGHRGGKLLVFLVDIVKFCLISAVGATVMAGLVAIAWLESLSGDYRVLFSKEGGFYDTNVQLILTSAGNVVPGMAGIRYNLNGDAMYEASTLAYEKDKPIVLEVPEEGYAVYTVQAAYCRNGGKCGKTYRETYVLGKRLEKDVNLDVMNILVDRQSLYDYDVGIMVKGKTYDEEFDESADYVKGNYNMRTEEWIRDAYVVMYNVDGERVLDRGMGIQISGGTSAAVEVKSFKLVGNRKYGYDGIPFDFGEGLQIYNSVRLRAGQDDVYGKIRSSVASRLAKESGFDGMPETKHMVVFLNNEFYGILDAQQSYSDSYLAQKYELLDKGSIVKHKSSEIGALEAAEVDGLFKSDLSVAANREKLEAVVDMNNYLWYYAMQIMWNNTDWPMNNYEMWKYEGGSKDEKDNPYEDGRWRFLVYDLDLIYYTKGNIAPFESATEDQFAALMGEKDVQRANGSSFKNVMASKYYAEKFVDILDLLINGAFTTKNVLKIVEEEAEKIEPQIKLNYSTSEYKEWQKNIELIKTAVRERNDIVRQDVKKYFGKTI